MCSSDLFMQGMEKIVKETKDDSPVWQVMCCASAAHKKNVTQMQKLQDDYNSLRSKVEGGTFRTEEARVGEKRKEAEEPSRSGNAWDEFEIMCRGAALGSYVPDEKLIKELRSEWRPI